MIPVIIIVSVFFLLLFIKMSTKKKKIAFLAGYVLTLLFLFCSVLLLFSSLQWNIFLSLLAISYISVILFLVLWNIKESKKVFLLFCVPVLCIAAGIIANIHFNKIKEIPIVSERGISFYYYIPFEKGNLLKTLDEEPGFKITNNLPVLDGATALLPVYASFVQAVYQEESFIDTTSEKFILCSGTDRAYKNLLEGRVDIIFCAEPSKSQMEQFYDNGIKLKLIPIGREAFVFFVNKNNVVNDISMDNIRGIYSGNIKNWKELNGKNQKIIAFQREKNSGSQTMLEKITGVPLMNPQRENIHGTMAGIINRVADYKNFPNAIGFSFLYFAIEMVQNEQIKILSINGIYPSKETIQNNTYPFCGNFYAIYIDNDHVNENTEQFIDWILSKQGQALISKTGYETIGGNNE